MGKRRRDPAELANVLLEIMCLEARPIVVAVEVPGVSAGEVVREVRRLRRTIA